MGKIFRVKSLEQLQKIRKEWEATLDTGEINHAVNIIMSDDGRYMDVINEQGHRISYKVEKINRGGN